MFAAFYVYFLSLNYFGLLIGIDFAHVTAWQL